MITYIAHLLKIIFAANLGFISVFDIKQKLVPWKGIIFSFCIAAVYLILAFIGNTETAVSSGFNTECGLNLLKGGGLLLTISVLVGLTGCLGGGDIWIFWAVGLMFGIKSGLEIMMTAFLTSGCFIFLVIIYCKISHLCEKLARHRRPFRRSRLISICRSVSIRANRILHDNGIAFVPFITIGVICQV